MTKPKFDVDAGRKDFFGNVTPHPVVEATNKTTKEVKSSSNIRTSIYLDHYRRNMVKAYVLDQRVKGNPRFLVKDFYSEAVDKMISENPHLKPYEEDLL